MNSHAPAFFKGVTASQAEIAILALAALLVIILLARTLGHLVKALAKAAAPAPAAKPSRKPLKPLLLAAVAGGGFWYWDTHLRHTPAPKAAPAPHPSPQPTVTATVTPHPVTHFVMPHLSGGVVIGIFVVGAIVAITLLGPLLRRSS